MVESFLALTDSSFDQQDTENRKSWLGCQTTRISHPLLLRSQTDTMIAEQPVTATLSFYIELCKHVVYTFN